jgi:hypothetical protein
LILLFFVFNDFSSLGYSKFLLGLGKLPEPKYCNNYNCRKRSTCFTDYTPHHPKNMTIADRVVGKTHWSYEDGKRFVIFCIFFSSFIGFLA